MRAGHSYANIHTTLLARRRDPRPDQRRGSEGVRRLDQLRAGGVCGPSPARARPATGSRRRRHRHRGWRHRRARRGAGRSFRQSPGRARALRRRGPSSARLEAFERVPDEGGREARAAIEHVQLDRAVAPAPRGSDAPPPVTHRVVDQVAERLLEPEPIAVEPPAAGLDRRRHPARAKRRATVFNSSA